MGEGAGLPTSNIPKPGKIISTATLHQCTFAFSVRPLVEVFRNGIVPAPTAARFAPERSAAKPARKRNLPSAPTPSIGFSSELLPTFALRLKPLQRCIRELSRTQLVTRPSPEPFSSTPISTTFSDSCCYASFSRCRFMRQNPFAVSSPTTIPCSPCCNVFRIKSVGTSSRLEPHFLFSLPTRKIPNCGAARFPSELIFPHTFLNLEERNSLLRNLPSD